MGDMRVTGGAPPGNPPAAGAPSSGNPVTGGAPPGNPPAAGAPSGNLPTGGAPGNRPQDNPQFIQSRQSQEQGAILQTLGGMTNDPVSMAIGGAVSAAGKKAEQNYRATLPQNF